MDEYQDTNPLQQRLLELWLGDRDDLCVVGDEDQTIYTFTGASSDYLTGFTSRFPGAREVTLSRNYRSYAGDPGAREPAAGRGGPTETPRADDAVRAGALDPSVP